MPDLIQKVLKGQDPLHILGDGQQVRHYTYGADLARGIRLCIEKPEAVNEDFNLSTDASTTVLELGQMIWEKLRPGEPFRYVSDPPYAYDVQKRCRIPPRRPAPRFPRHDAAKRSAGHGDSVGEATSFVWEHLTKSRGPRQPDAQRRSRNRRLSP